jgi:hypothetical protein
VHTTASSSPTGSPSTRRTSRSIGRPASTPSIKSAPSRQSSTG